MVFFDEYEINDFLYILCPTALARPGGPADRRECSPGHPGPLRIVTDHPPSIRGSRERPWASGTNTIAPSTAGGSARRRPIPEQPDLGRITILSRKM